MGTDPYAGIATTEESQGSDPYAGIATTEPKGDGQPAHVQNLIQSLGPLLKQGAKSAVRGIVGAVATPAPAYARQDVNPQQAIAAGKDSFVNQAMAHPIQTTKGLGLGMASTATNYGPQYTSGGGMEKLGTPEQAQRASEMVEQQAQTPQEKRAFTVGQMIAPMPAGGEGWKAGENLVEGAVKGLTKDVATRATEKIDAAIEKGISKGIKPTVVGKKTLARRDKFYSDANDAVKTIADNRDKINIIDENGETAPHPRSSAEMAQAVDQTKKIIYKQYHDMALAAGDAGAKFETAPIIAKIDEVTTDLKESPETREYAESLKGEIEELDGQSPEIVEARIKDLNSSLAGFYEGRVAKAKARIDASVANLMREGLDNKITGAVGEGYQGIKNKYGALKAIEKEVNHRAIVNARKAGKSVIDMTDIFTGGDLTAGILTANPMLIAKGVAGRGLKEIYKAINNPDRAVSKMFRKVYGLSDKIGAKTPIEDVVSRIKGEPPQPPGPASPPVGGEAPMPATTAPTATATKTQFIPGREQGAPEPQQSDPLQLKAATARNPLGNQGGYIDMGGAAAPVAPAPNVPRGTPGQALMTPEQAAHVEQLRVDLQANNKATEEALDLTPMEQHIKKSQNTIDFLKNSRYVYDEEKKAYVFNPDPAAVEQHWADAGSYGRASTQDADKLHESIQSERPSTTIPRENTEVPPAPSADGKAGENVENAKPGNSSFVEPPAPVAETARTRSTAASSEDWHEDPEVNHAQLAYSLKRELETAIKRQPDGKQQWKLVSGQITRDKNGQLLQQSPHTQSVLQAVVDNYNTTEGLDIVKNALGRESLFEHPDDVVNFISDAPSAKELRELRKPKVEESGGEQQDYEESQAEKAAEEKSHEEQAAIEEARSPMQRVVDGLRGDQAGSISVKGGKKSVLEQLTSPNPDYEDVSVVDGPSRGFLLPSGEFLDIGGQDHRYINGMVDYGKNKEDYYYNGRGSRSEKMFQIMRDSNSIRYIPESNQFQILSRPTPKQLQQIENYVKENGKVEIEVGENSEATTYDENNVFDLSDDVSRKLDGGQRGSVSIGKAAKDVIGPGSTLGLLGSATKRVLGTGSGLGALSRSASGATIGAGAGYATGKTPEERKRNAVIGAIAGGAGGLAPEVVAGLRKGVGMKDVVDAIKGSVGNNKGAVDVGRDAATEPLYSNAQKAVSEINMPKAPASQWLSMLDPVKGKGTKADEMKWIGLDDFLKEKGSETVTKQEIQGFIEQNKVQLEEVTKDAGQHEGYVFKDDGWGDYWANEAHSKDEWRRLLEEDDNFKQSYDDYKEQIDEENSFKEETGEPLDEAMPFEDFLKQTLDKDLKSAGGYDNTKFSSYQLPGGENYREVLLKLPAEQTVASKPLTVKERQEYNDLLDAQATSARGLSGEDDDRLQKLAERAFFEKPKPIGQKGKDFYKSPHWEEPNVLAHYRLNDRVDSEGKKVLFVEEIQSDWHQTGRRDGYDVNDTWEAAKKFTVIPSTGGFNVEDEHGRVWAMLSDLDRANAKAAELTERGIPAGHKKGGVPAAPFSKTWHELAFKKILREAAEKGYDKVAWTTGEQQAARYDLSKQIEKITHSKNGDGTYNVHVVDKAERDVYDKMNVPEEDLEPLLGKEMAQKIINREGTIRNRPGIDNDYFTKRGKATGTVKDGNSWYITWEDGSKSGTYLSSESAKREGEQITRDYVTNSPDNKPKTLSGLDLKVGGNGMKGFYDKILVDYANKYGKKWGSRVEDATINAPYEPKVGGVSRNKNWVGDKEPFMVHSMTITPAMKKSVMEEGQPMFSVAAGAGAAGTLAASQQDKGKDNKKSGIADVVSLMKQSQ